VPLVARAAWLLAAFALVAASARAAEPARVIASLRVNGVAHGDIVIVQGAHDVYVRARDLIGVAFPRRPATTTIDGDVYDSLGSSGIAYTYDSASLTLELTYRVSTRQRLDVRVPPATLYRNGSSATVAYAGAFQRGGPPALSERMTFAMPGGVAHLGFAKINGVVYRTGLDADFYEKGENGEILLGDQLLASGGVLPSLPIFGVGVTHGTSVRTSADRAPFERVCGILRDPATIRIDVAGEEPIDVGLEPGPFSIDGIPVAAHVSAVDNLTNLPVRIDVRPRLDARLLAPGWHEFTIAAGVPRTCVYACATYRGFAIGGSLLTGDTLSLSSGPHAEYFDGRVGIGYDVVAADPDHALRLSVGFGPLDGTLVSYVQRAGPLSFGIGYGANGAPAFGENARLAMPRRNTYQTLSASYRTLRFQYQLSDYRRSGSVQSYDLIDSVRVFHTVLQLDLRDRRARGRTGNVSLGVLFPLAIRRWRDTTLLGATIGAHQGPAAVLSSEINTPSGLEVGGTSGALHVSYVSDAIEISSSSAGTLAISGALAFLHGVHPLRDADAGYAVAVGRPGDLIADTNGRIHTVGAGSASAFPLPSSNHPTGVTYVQRNDTLDGSAALSVSHVYPAPGAGALVVITHARLSAVIGAVAGPRWRYGTIALANGASSPIGSDGMFYFEGLSAGSYRADVSGRDGSCTATVVVPLSNERQIDIGSISCVPVLRQ